MIVRKKFKVLGSNRLPNGSFVSVEFGTEFEEDIDPEVLMDKVYNDVYKDIKKYKKKDPLVRSCWESLIAGIKQEQKVSDHDK